ncbi:MAG: hypothetical protein ACR650_16600 [Methylocystis sp.]
MSLQTANMEFRMTPQVIDSHTESVVQNGTAGTTAGWEGYVEKFQSLRKGTAESVIDLAIILVEAEDKLSKEDFCSFCGEAEIAKGQSYHKKLRTIGKNASRLKPHLEHLPHCWTTIYKLAQMPADKFDDFMAAGALSPKTKAKDISKFLGGSANDEGAAKPSRGLDAGQRVVISFGKLDAETKRQVAAEIAELAKDLLESPSGQDVGASNPLHIAA